MARRTHVWFTAVAAVFVASCLPYLGLALGSDSWKNLWLVQNVPFWTFLSDPLAAGYVFRFYFEPVWTLLYYVDVAAEPWVGGIAYRLVNIFAALVIAAQIVAYVGPTARAGGIAAALLFLLSPPVWFCVGLPTARNYLVGTVFALLALWPFWRAHERRTPVSWVQALVSGLCYGLAVGSKEAMATLPVLLFFLDLRAGRRLPGAVATMLPHMVALALLLAWRWHILGSIGGYWMQTPVLPSNVVTVFPMLADFLWGAAWPVVALVIVAVFWRGGATATSVALGCFVAVAPFALAGDLVDGGYYPFASARLLLPWALIVILIGHVVAKLSGRGAQVAVVLGIACLGLQWSQRSVTDVGLAMLLPADALPAADAAEPFAIISSASMALAYEHQARPNPKPILAAYQSPPSYQLDRALGWKLPAGARTERIRADWIVPKLTPLALGDSQVWADASGHFHARLAAGVERDLTLSWIHENGATRWVATLPVGRRRIDLPLSYSVRAIVLSRVSLESDRWETFVWESPFFRPTYP